MHLRISSSLYNGKDLQDNKAMMQLLKATQLNSSQEQVQQHHHYNHCHNHQIFSKGTWTKRLILWSILLIQFGFILCFWLMQLGLSGKLGETTAENRDLVENRINFLHSETLKSMNKNINDKKDINAVNFHWASRELNFQDDFFLHQSANNFSQAEKIMFGESSLWCFKEGTINESQYKTNAWDDSSSFSEYCKCLPEWHGRDCGQPEVIWRALLAGKITFKIKDPTKDEAHRLVYMMEGMFLNLDLIELQIKSVSKVVDYFIVYLKMQYASAKQFKSLKFRLKQILPKRNYFLYHCKLPSYNNCSSAEAYRLFRKYQLLTNAIKPSDIFILTDDKTILGHRALNFIKYYSSDITPVIRFRLKYTVYGFYWQHPKKTHLSGLISSFQSIDNTDASPNQLLTQVTTSQNRQQQQSALVIGDLNHIGGWFCKYCQEPDEIINELQLSSSSSATLLLSIPSVTKMLSLTSSSPPKSIQNTVLLPFNEQQSSPQVDVAYIQQLISRGIYLKDGKTQLQKVSRYTDKYYAPQYASEQSWKYGHVLINIYESLEDILANDNEELF